MCHEAWWRERRARRDEESREIWRDFERVWPADPPAVPDERPEVTRLDSEEQEAVPAQR
jgi:hypothetical protein